MSLNDTARKLWDFSPKHRGRRMSLWAKDGKTRKERQRRWEAVNDVARARAHWVRRRSWRLWQLYHGIAKWTGRVAKRLRKRIRRDQKPKGADGVGGVNVTSTAAGDPYWGGAGSVMSQFVVPFMHKRGLGWSSHKRTPAQNAAVGGSPVSDHLTTHTTTDAYDFPTYSGEDDARALAQALGISNWSPNSYASNYVTIDGHRFRVQILWGSGIGHGDHVHVGVGR